MRPEDRYFPSYYADSLPRDKSPHNRANIDPYATLTPSERLRGTEQGLCAVRLLCRGCHISLTVRVPSVNRDGSLTVIVGSMLHGLSDLTSVWLH